MPWRIGRPFVAKSAIDICPYRHIIEVMPRAATSSDVFNAIAEPQRRAILGLLASREHPVGDVVVALRLTQPAVSKHLRVLRDVGLVQVRRDGRRKLYRTNAQAVRPIHDWAGMFERYWEKQLDRIKKRAESKSRSTLDPDDSPKGE